MKLVPVAQFLSPCSRYTWCLILHLLSPPLISTWYSRQFCTHCQPLLFCASSFFFVKPQDAYMGRNCREGVNTQETWAWCRNLSISIQTLHPLESRGTFYTVPHGVSRGLKPQLLKVLASSII